jgi:hypothetical protein
MTEIFAVRNFPLLFIILDLAWLLVLGGILLATGRRLAFIVGLAGGVLYQIVDYGIFYLALGTRHVTGGDPFWVLLWMSMSYGFTNFVLIWLWLDRDGHQAEWCFLVVCGWLAVAFLAMEFGAGWPAVGTSRGTGSYHGVMALIMLAGYAWLALRNLRRPAEQRVSLPYLLAIGVGVQFAWEAVLLLAGVRPTGWQALVVNSLIETNLGLPWLWLIHHRISGRWNEDLGRAAARPQNNGGGPA